MKKCIFVIAAVLIWIASGFDATQACHKHRCHARRAVWGQPCGQPVCEAHPFVPAPAWKPLRTVQLKSGRNLMLFDSGDDGNYAEEEPGRPPLMGDVDEFNDYVGNDRRAAKISFVNGPEKLFANVGELFDFVTTGDRTEENMKALHISRDKESNRVDVEKVKVTVEGYVYAFKKEDNDNDYHVIIGDPPGTPGQEFFNAEVSGLPPGGLERQVLKQVRDTFKGHYQLPDQDSPNSNYVTHAPVRVRVTGSLFFDVIHLKQKVGPAAFKPKSAWEIHPITELTFLDEPQ